MTSPPSETTRTLMKARDILEKGWCQGRLEIGDKHCIAGAIRLAMGIPVDNSLSRSSRCDEYWVVSNAVASAIGWNDVVSFNDERDRTHAEVLEAMDRAIQLSMQEG